MRPEPAAATWPRRVSMALVPPVPVDGRGSPPAGTVARLLDGLRQSAFQGRKLGEAFEVWRWMLDEGCLVAHREAQRRPDRPRRRHTFLTHRHLLLR